MPETEHAQTVLNQTIFRGGRGHDKSYSHSERLTAVACPK
jgi:hypothetical protein